MNTIDSDLRAQSQAMSTSVTDEIPVAENYEKLFNAMTDPDIHLPVFEENEFEGETEQLCCEKCGWYQQVPLQVDDYRCVNKSCQAKRKFLSLPAEDWHEDTWNGEMVKGVQQKYGDVAEPLKNEPLGSLHEEGDVPVGWGRYMEKQRLFWTHRPKKREILMKVKHDERIGPHASTIVPVNPIRGEVYEWRCDTCHVPQFAWKGEPKCRTTTNAITADGDEYQEACNGKMHPTGFATMVGGDDDFTSVTPSCNCVRCMFRKAERAVERMLEDVFYDRKKVSGKDKQYISGYEYVDDTNDPLPTISSRDSGTSLGHDGGDFGDGYMSSTSANTQKKTVCYINIPDDRILPFEEKRAKAIENADKKRAYMLRLKQTVQKGGKPSDTVTKDTAKWYHYWVGKNSHDKPHGNYELISTCFQNLNLDEIPDNMDERKVKAFLWDIRQDDVVSAVTKHVLPLIDSQESIRKKSQIEVDSETKKFFGL